MDKYRGLIFDGALIPGLMAGTVGVTSRVMKTQPPEGTTGIARAIAPGEEPLWRYLIFRGLNCIGTLFCPFLVGEKRYVKETWAEDEGDEGLVCFYKATDHPSCGQPWRSPMMMPRRYARTWFEFTGVKAARCQDITEAEAIASGCRPYFDHDNPVQVQSPNGNVHPFAPLKGPIDAYAALWDRLHGKPEYVKGAGFGGATLRVEPRYRWQDNPWVWRLSLKLCEAPE